MDEDGSYGIWVMNADGSGQRRLTRNPRGTDESPSWSPDGRTIVFARSRFVTTVPDPIPGEEHGDLYTVAADGGEPELLLGGPTDDFSPAWSPGGEAIAFVRSGGTPPFAIWLLPLTGGDRPVEVASVRGDALRPSWSPDGAWLAFDAGGAIWAVHPGGTGLRRVIAPPPGEPWTFAGATWSPDGAWLAASGPGGIHIVRFEGAPAERILRVEGSGPSWGLPPSAAAPESPSPAVPGRVTHTIDVGEANAVLDAAGSVWAGTAGDPASAEATLLRIDPETGEVLAQISVGVRPGAETGGAGIAFDGRSVWIVGQVAGASSYRAGLTRVDPATNEATRFDLPVGVADALVFDDGSLWTTGYESPDGRDPRVLRIDPETGEVVAQIPVAAAARWASVGAVVAVEEGIWVRANVAPNVPGEIALVRLDPLTGEELMRLPLEDATGVTSGAGPVLGGRAIWAATGSELLMIDPAAGEVVARFPASVGQGIHGPGCARGGAGIGMGPALRRNADARGRGVTEPRPSVRSPRAARAPPGAGRSWRAVRRG